MKKYLFLLALVAISISLSAQQGLFGISYDEPLLEANAKLTQFRFETAELEGNMVKYYTKDHPRIEAVILFVHPDTDRVVGWFVKHWASNSEEESGIVIGTMKALHGEPAMYDKDTDQLIWIFSVDRSAHALFVGDDSLCVLYTDSRYNELFQMNQLHEMGQGKPEKPVEKEGKKGVQPQSDSTQSTE